MSSKKVIAIAGATGAQGRSVSRFLLHDGTFAVRAFTRNPDSTAAKELAAKGAEIVKVDLRDSAAVAKAVVGVYGLFANTTYWVPGVGFDGEVAQGKSLVDAAKAAGIKHFVWSNLDSTPQQAAHWESKDVVDKYLQQSGVGRTSLYTCFYFENAVALPLGKREDGSYEYPLPLITDAPFAVYCAAETGAFVLPAFLHPETWLGKDIRIAAEFLSVREMAKTMSEVSGRTVHVQEVDAEAYESAKGTMPDEIHANFLALFANPGPPFRDPALARQLYPSMKTFREWAQENVARLFPE